MMSQETMKGAPHINVDELRRLDHWCAQLSDMFHGTTPYLVGSALYRRDWRDVDIRLRLGGKRYRQLERVTTVLDLNMLLSQWGRQQTDLPIDCQLQSGIEWTKHDGLLNPRLIHRGSYE